MTDRDFHDFKEAVNVRLTSIEGEQKLIRTEAKANHSDLLVKLEPVGKLAGIVDRHETSIRRGEGVLAVLGVIWTGLLYFGSRFVGKVHS